GDTITHVDGAKIITASDVTQRVMLMPEQTLPIRLVRDSEDLTIDITLEAKEYDDGLGNVAKIGFLGVVLPQAFERAPSFADAVSRGIGEGIFTTYAQFTALKQILTGERQILELSGPIRIAKMSGETLSLGMMP